MTMQRYEFDPEYQRNLELDCAEEEAFDLVKAEIMLLSHIEAIKDIAETLPAISPTYDELRGMFRDCADEASAAILQILREHLDTQADILGEKENELFARKQREYDRQLAKTLASARLGDVA